ncbi:Mannose-6-phosphate isomerase type I protein [Dioscorea alata]|uniref:Mannose-6-phosphate isomerase type I protein n=1 Tax=Dioscorea alata TaxID=55571 RepID=A0ACB7UDZ1_DIOAL|nr:Mannose-6-phosphate isomerase type I protein [Dioscorea alata]
MKDIPKPQRLRCSVQNYDWGRTGEESTVAVLFSRNNPIDPEKPYAEFWIGTHPSGPSSLLSLGSSDSQPVLLKSWILENPSSVLGDKVSEKWHGDLPFLFKVLSVAKALSIQAHPDKELAKALHEMNPSVYKDSNHKPEMAIALTEFKALCGFVGIESSCLRKEKAVFFFPYGFRFLHCFIKELKDILTSVPEIRDMIGDEHIDKYMSIKETDPSDETKVVLRSIYTKLMSTSEEVVSESVSKLKHRLNTESKVRMLTEKEELALRLEQQYPNDIGVISSFFFNYVKLIPGEALHIGANEPHAYISGECVECMATSDNVVRAGLTPKYKDVQTLCSMLTYKQARLSRDFAADSFE